MFKISGLLAAAAALVASPAMAADWYVAETEHFVIYSEDGQEETEDFARDLERLDEVLRIVSGVGNDDKYLPDSAKVTVFRYGETKDMATLAGEPGSGIGGFFIPRASGSYAFVPREANKRRARSNFRRREGLGLEPKAVLYHEYVHYFMFQHRNAPYPAWYREGFAEIFSTVEADGDEFVVGDVPTWRSIGIMALDIDVEAMMAPTRSNGGYNVARTYGHGWLLSSYLNFTPERRPQITEYVRLLATGTDRLEAAKQAFGDLDQLEKELNEYRRSAALIMRGRYINTEPPKVDIRRLGEDEEAVIDLMIESKVGVDEKEAARQLPKARKLVAQYPDSIPVLMAAAEVEFDNKNYDEADALAKKVQALDPKSSDALIQQGNVAFMQAYDNPEKMVEARKLFVAANQLEPDHPIPLYHYYLTFLLAGDEVDSGAEAALESAYEYAPFDPGVRVALAHMFLKQDRVDITSALLSPLIQQASGSKFARCLSSELEQAEEGEKAPLLERLMPEHPRADEDKDEDEDEDEFAGCGEEDEDED
ncbi:hypothetical protein K3152_06165 [Qipengyuania sp. 1NDH17]|uniref:Tetratricopeptide repeat protein n=1 Tax=Qipengyuania polymorpha TaxID=2867234 RepID=A0ABS7J0I3_9SPHN|nr:hypothetical protein [Qipengyuania polymorpha]MBX7457825.1 hypothetical protein [Qipengyuania polymorpha]